MEKNRLYVIVAAIVAILGACSTWVTFNGGILGSTSAKGIDDPAGWIVIICGIVSIIAAVVYKMNEPMNRIAAEWVSTAGVFSTIITVYNLVDVYQTSVKFGNYGFSFGYGLIMSLVASIVLIVLARIAVGISKHIEEQG